MSRWDGVFRTFRQEAMAQPITRANQGMTHFMQVGELYVGLTINK